MTGLRPGWVSVTTAMGAALRRIQLGNALSAFGNGFTVPFLFVYVAQVRGLGAGTAGVVLSAFAASALLVLPFTGRWIDGRGPLPVVTAGAVVSALGSLGFGLSSTAGLAVLSSAVRGAGFAVTQPALATLIVWCTTPASRSRAFATQFFVQNLGLGIGGLIGGLIVDVDRPGSFVRLFVIEAAMFLVLAAIVATVRMPYSPRVEAAPRQSGGGWRAVLRDRSMVRLCVLGAVLFFACYGQFESGLAAFATQVTRIAPSTLGVALAANTAVIVVAQFLVLRPVERRRRSRVIALVGVVWAVAWAVAGFSGLVHGERTLATCAIVSAYALFGLGESLLSPTVSPLVADLAPDGLVGQYNSAFALVKQLALAVGPAAGGAMAAAGLYGVYVPALVAASLGVTALALRMGRGLGAAQDRPVTVAPAAQELVAA
jgi:MFS family permease